MFGYTILLGNVELLIHAFSEILLGWYLQYMTSNILSVTFSLLFITTKFFLFIYGCVGSWFLHREFL